MDQNVWFRVEKLDFRDRGWASELRIWGLGFRFKFEGARLGFEDRGVGCRGQGFGGGVWGVRLRVQSRIWGWN